MKGPPAWIWGAVLVLGVAVFLLIASGCSTIGAVRSPQGCQERNREALEIVREGEAYCDSLELMAKEAYRRIEADSLRHEPQLLGAKLLALRLMLRNNRYVRGQFARVKRILEGD
jgi:hypothetical protein